MQDSISLVFAFALGLTLPGVLSQRHSLPEVSPQLSTSATTTPQLQAQKLEFDAAKTRPIPSPSATVAEQYSLAEQNFPACVQTDCNCRDFTHQSQAQAILTAFPNDPYRLDANKDGIACDRLPK